MNISMLPHYGISRLADRLRMLAFTIERKAALLEANLNLTKAQKTILHANKVFENKHKGQAAIVIGNGPSLADQDLKKLKNKITFCVNGFWKHEIINFWQPTYYSLMDPNFFLESKITDNFYCELNRRITDSIFFLPLFRGYDAVHKNKILPIERCHFVASVGDYGRYDLTGIVRSFPGVVSFALAQAVYMGCNPIYLLGCDHDYLAKRGVDKHFYEGSILPGHLQAYTPLENRTPYDVEMRMNLSLWSVYRQIKAIAQRRGIEILNATNGGYLDVFDRFDYEKIS